MTTTLNDDEAAYGEAIDLISFDGELSDAASKAISTLAAQVVQCRASAAHWRAVAETRLEVIEAKNGENVSLKDEIRWLRDQFNAAIAEARP